MGWKKTGTRHIRGDREDQSVTAASMEKHGSLAKSRLRWYDVRKTPPAAFSSALATDGGRLDLSSYIHLQFAKQLEEEPRALREGQGATGQYEFTFLVW